MPAAGGHHQCRGYSKNNEGDTYIQERLNHPSNIMWTLEFPSLPFFIPSKKMKAYLEERRSNASHFLPSPTYPDRPTKLPPAKSQAPQKKKAREVKKRRQYNPSTSAPRTTAATIITPTLCTTFNPINPVIMMSVWSTTSTTTVNLSVPSNPPNIMERPSTPKPQTFKSWPRPYTLAPFTDWSSDDNCNRTKQKEKISKVQ